MFQQQNFQSQTQQFSASSGNNSSVRSQNLPQGPNSAGTSNNSNGTNPFGHQIIISSQQTTSGDSNFITINPGGGVMSRSNSLTGGMQAAESHNMLGGQQTTSTTFYQQSPHFAKVQSPPHLFKSKNSLLLQLAHNIPTTLVLVI